jgi:hypothetical protein
LRSWTGAGGTRRRRKKKRRRQKKEGEKRKKNTSGRMLNIPRRLRRRLASLTVLLFLATSVWYIVLPPDSAVRLAVLFNAARLSIQIGEGLGNDRDAWLQQHLHQHQQKIDLEADVGYLVKTGYGTRHRLPAQLEAFSRAGPVLSGGLDGGPAGAGRREEQNLVVVGDWTTVNATDAAVLGIRVHDAIRPVMENKVGEKLRGHARFAKYQNLQDAVDAGDEARANELGRDYGWELDALKFIMGMEMLYLRIPDKKWYIILDDDTFLVKPSLELFLSRLDAQMPQYIGNAVGDYKGRFAHGGSAVILSGAAMRRLFSRPDIVVKAYAASLDETWGDKLVATTLQKLGIYLDERYSHHFNGEPPEITRITTDKFCSPLVSFHGLRKPGAMLNAGRSLAHLGRPLRWGDVWERFGNYPLLYLAGQPVQSKQDHIGPVVGDVKVFKRVKSAEACRKKCERSGSACLAWTFEQKTKTCRGSAWMVIGVGAAEGILSGVNWLQIESLLRKCP